MRKRAVVYRRHWRMLPRSMVPSRRPSKMTMGIGNGGRSICLQCKAKDRMVSKTLHLHSRGSCCSLTFLSYNRFTTSYLYCTAIRISFTPIGATRSNNLLLRLISSTPAKFPCSNARSSNSRGMSRQPRSMRMASSAGATITPPAEQVQARPSHQATYSWEVLLD